MLKSPLVSVIIPAYNHANYVEEAIKSVLNQTYRNIEVIIVDDGSKDTTPKIIENVVRNNKTKIKIHFIQQKNMGVAKTLNHALNMAKGIYVSFLASDDAYLPDKIKEGLNVLMKCNNTYAASYTDGYIINSKGKIIELHSKRGIVPVSRNVYKELLIGNWFAALSILYRKSVLVEVGLFDENLEVEDYDIQLRISKKYKYKYIPIPLFLYRSHDNNYSNNDEKMKCQLSIIAKKNSDIMNFQIFRKMLKNCDPSVYKHIKMLNIELLLRYYLRRLQYKFNLSNLNCDRFIYSIKQKLQNMK